MPKYHTAGARRVPLGVQGRVDPGRAIAAAMYHMDPPDHLLDLWFVTFRPRLGGGRSGRDLAAGCRTRLNAPLLGWPGAARNSHTFLYAGRSRETLAFRPAPVQRPGPSRHKPRARRLEPALAVISAI
jgi:hypothetical protein